MSKKGLQNRWQGSHKAWKSRMAAVLALLMTFSTAGAEVPAAEAPAIELETSEVAAPEIVEKKLPAGGVKYEAYDATEEEVQDLPIYGGIAAYGLVVSEVNALPAVSTRYGYSQLTSAQKAFYNDCLSAISNYLDGDYKTKNYTSDGSKAQAIFGVSHSGLSTAEAAAAFTCLRNDYPELYWLYYGYTASGTTLYLMLGTEYLQAADRLSMDTAISKGLEEYKTAVSGITDEYEIVRTVHDKLLTDVDYAYDSTGQPEDALWAHSIAGVFGGNDEVVCEGYAKTLQYVLDTVGIENIYIVGDAGGGHAWNAVQLDGEWLYIDATWDDPGSDEAGDATGYSYFCIPASTFERSHTANTPRHTGLNWLYELPEMSDSDEYTFYSKYGCDFTAVTSQEEVDAKLRAAGALVPGQYIHALSTETIWNRYIGRVEGSVRSFYAADEASIITLIDATSYKVENPATSITISKSELEIDRDVSKTATLTASVSSSSGACDDIVRWTSSSSCVTVKASSDGKSVEITGKRNGTATVTATAAVGGVTATCTVTVIGTAEYENIYLDAACSETPDEEDFTIWVNGGNVGQTKDTKYNYKMRSLYTNIRPSTITTTNAKGKTKTKNGKLVAGITLSAEEPTLVKNKIVDAEAAKIAKATVNAKTGLIKVTAQKQPGEVYLWIIDTGDEGAVAYAKITVTAAAGKTVVNDAEYTVDDREIVKKETLAIDESLNVYLEPLVKNKNPEIAEGSTYYVTYSKGGEEYVKVTPISGAKYGYTITPTSLNASKPGKTTKATVYFVCTQNNKKASVSITITNPMKSITYAAGTGVTKTAENTFTVPTSDTAAQTFTLDFSTVATNTSFDTTDKMKVYAVSDASGITFDAKGKIKVTKPSGDAAKIKATLSKDKRSITIKVPKKLPVGTKSYFFLYFNNNCYKVFSVEAVQSTSAE